MEKWDHSPEIKWTESLSAINWNCLWLSLASVEVHKLLKYVYMFLWIAEGCFFFFPQIKYL